MADQDASPAETELLEKLREPDRGFPERVLEELAAELEQEPGDTEAVLDDLEARGAVQSEMDARMEKRIWVATES